MTSQAEDVQARIQARSSMSATPTVRHSFTKQHFRAAELFATSAEGLECEIRTANQKDTIGKSRHRAFVVGAIVSAVMGLEACINEIYIDACGKSKKLAGLDEAAMALLALWWPEIERRPILLKYEHALLLLGKPQLPRGANPYQDVDNLIHLRNVLTHYKPERDDSLDEADALESRLTGRFDLNPLSTRANRWFPHQCLGSGCAKWAVRTSAEFVQSFCASLAIAARV